MEKTIDHEAGFLRYSTGMVRSTDVEKYAFHLISPPAFRAWAAAYREGIDKGYTAFNCEKGCSANEFLNHAINHIFEALAGYRPVYTLGKAMWNVGMAIHSLEMWPHLNEDMRRQGCVPPGVTDADAECWRRMDHGAKDDTPGVPTSIEAEEESVFGPAPTLQSEADRLLKNLMHADREYREACSRLLGRALGDLPIRPGRPVYDAREPEPVAGYRSPVDMVF